MSTDFNILGKGLRQLAILLFLFIASPIVLTMGFKALKKYDGTPQMFWSYIILGIGAILLFFSIYFAFKTFKTLLKAIFKDS